MSPRKIKWIFGFAAICAILAAILIKPLPILFYHNLPYVDFVARAVYIILFASFLCLIRIMRGPTAADRIAAIDIIGMLIVGFCAVLTISTSRQWYMDIAIAWALQNIVSILALSKYLEGKGFEE